MALAPHQQRVVEERNELVDKICKLRAFILGELFPNLDKNEQGRLTCQLAIMAAYQEVLQARIAHFS